MDFSFWPVEFMLSFLIGFSGPETAMNDMQRSASGGTRQPRAPSSVLRTCGLHHAESCGGNRVEGKFSLLQTVEIARNAEIYGGCIDGASMQIEIETSRPHAASEVSCPVAAPEPRGRCPFDRACPVALDRGGGLQAVAPARRQRRIAQRGVAHAPGGQVRRHALLARPLRPP